MSEIDERRTQYLYWWLLVAIIFEYARPGAFLPVISALKLNSLIPLSLLAVTFFAPGLRPIKDIIEDRYSRWLIGFLAVLLISVPFAEVTLYAYTVFKATLGYFFLFLIIARVVTSVRRLRGVFLTLILSHAFLIAMTPEIVTNPAVRTYIQGGTFLGDGNDFSLSLCILVPMAVELAVGAESKLFRITAWGLLVLILLAIVASQSRGASLAAAAVLGFLWLFSRRKFLTLAAIGCVGLLVALYGSEAYFERMRTISSYQTEESAEGRILAWKAARLMAIDHPLMGVGAGHFAVAFGTTYKPKEYASFPWMTAHSMYFLVLGELGVPGFAVYCVLVFGNIRAAMLARRRVLAVARGPPSPEVVASSRLLHLLAASMVGYAVAGAFLSVAYYPHVFILTGILLCARLLAGDTVATRTSAKALKGTRLSYPERRESRTRLQGG